jgi:cytidine deaminase
MKTCQKFIVKVVSFDELPRRYQKALKEAEKAMKKAPYNPYSGYSVGACALAADEKTFSGANIENIAFGSSICAERSALAHANARGYGDKIVAIAVITRSRDSSTTKISDSAPCGECRQAIMEAAWRSGCDIKIIMATTRMDKIAIASISELLPLAFEPNFN